MNINKEYIEEELGLNKQFTEEGMLFYEFGQGKYFYTSLQSYNDFYFVDEELSLHQNGAWSNGIISTIELFKKLYT